MTSHEPQTVTLNRQSILLVAGVGVGLLTLSYVLGVQVGKQTVNLRKPTARSLDEELKELPEPILDQMKYFENIEKASEKPAKAEAKAAERAPEAPPPEAKNPAPKPEPRKAEPPKPEPKKTEPPKPEPPGPRWTLQLVTTTDPTEIDRLAAKAKAAGYGTTVIKEKGVLKLRITQVGAREKIDASAAKLKDAGFKPFAVKVE